MSLEESIIANTEAVNRNSDLLERVIAGQEAAIAKIEGATGRSAGTRTRATTKTETQQEAKPEAAAAAEGKASSAQQGSENHLGITAFDNDSVRAYVQEELIAKIEDAKAREALVKEFILPVLCPHFGVKMPFGPEGLKTEEERQQLVFYIKRHIAGLEVNLSQDYDYDGPIDQGAAESSGGDADPMAGLG